MRVRFLLGLVLAASIAAGAGATRTPNPSEQQPAAASGVHAKYVIGISPFLNNANKDRAYRSIVGLIVEQLPLGSQLDLYDAFELKTIARVVVPDTQAFNSPKLRANQFASAIQGLKTFLALNHPQPSDGTMSFEDAVRLPQFLDFISENMRGTDAAPVVLVLGSPLYRDSKEPGFSMVDGFFPSDGYLEGSREQSIFGVEKGAAKIAMQVHWFFFDDPWISELHRDKVTRFWGLYLERRDCKLVELTSDLPTALRSFKDRMAAQTRGWTLVAGTKPEMLRVGREVAIADWLTRDELPDRNPAPPTTLIGPLKIGIRWAADVDLDLYAAPTPQGETLSFRHLRSAEGYYYKDHRSSPGKEYEFIEFEASVDIRQVEAFVNFYKGLWPAGPQGEVRIEFEGRIYSAPFSIRSESGNRGRTGPGSNEFWTRIPVQEILKVASPG